jgi:hypothetical protein
MKIYVWMRIPLIFILLLLQGCDFGFESSIPTIGFQTPIPQPWSIQGFEPTATLSPEMIEVVEAINLLFDPYRGTLPEDLIYEDSVYEELNNALAEAYRNCGYDLRSIAYKLGSNPMTEKKFEECLSMSEITDPISQEKFSTYDWLEKRLIFGGENPAYSEFLKKVGIDPNNPINYEPNYLNALMAAHSRRVQRAKDEFLMRLMNFHSNDASKALEYLELYKFGLMGTE